MLENYNSVEMIHGLKAPDAKKILLIVGVMTFHSLAEGIAMGVR